MIDELRMRLLSVLADAEQTVAKLKAILAEQGDEVVTDDSDDFNPINVIGVKEAAHLFGIDETTVTRLCRQGVGRKIGRRREWEVSIPRLRRQRNTTDVVD